MLRGTGRERWVLGRPSHTHRGEYGGRALRVQGLAPGSGARYLVQRTGKGRQRQEPRGAERRSQAASQQHPAAPERSWKERTAALSVEEKCCGCLIPAF